MKNKTINSKVHQKHILKIIGILNNNLSPNLIQRYSWLKVCTKGKGKGKFAPKLKLEPRHKDVLGSGAIDPHIL
jgi:hypothetical protein